MKQIGFHIPDTDDAPVSTSVLLGMSAVALTRHRQPLGPSEFARRVGRHGGGGHGGHADAAERQSAESDFHRGQMLALGSILDTIHEILGQPNHV